MDAGDAATTEPVLSPDGSRAAVSVFDADGETLASDLWLLDLVRGGRSRFTFEAAAEFEPVWSPDGTRVAFASSKGGTLDLCREACKRDWRRGAAVAHRASQAP